MSLLVARFNPAIGGGEEHEKRMANADLANVGHVMLVPRGKSVKSAREFASPRRLRQLRMMASATYNTVTVNHGPGIAQSIPGRLVGLGEAAHYLFETIGDACA